MNSKEIILHLMEMQNQSNADLAGKLGIQAATLWARFYGKNKHKDVTIPIFIQMLNALGYKLVVVPRTAKVQSDEYLVTVSSESDKSE